MAELFDVGARWLHRERDFLVIITEVVEPGQFRIAFFHPHNEEFEAVDAMMLGIVHGIWTAQDLVSFFEPIVGSPSRYEYILSDEFDEYEV